MRHCELVRELNACNEAMCWYERQTDDKTAWETCRRGDWLLWLAARVDVDRKLIVMAACDCAETAMKYVPEGKDSPRVTIETARRWCAGVATLEDVHTAAAYAAHAAADAAYAAAYAAHAAAAADAAHAVAAVYAAAERAATLAQCADIVRARISWETIEAKLQEATHETEAQQA